MSKVGGNAVEGLQNEIKDEALQGDSRVTRQMV
jgi:hypothetical protein